MKTMILMILLTTAFFGCASPSKSELDSEVNRLCAIDGGIKIYETISLPPNKFNKYGQINFYRPTQGENALGNDYIYKSEDQFYRNGNPSIIGYRHKVFRKSDGKLLGETISYGRGGGDIPGPWEPSNHHCPPTSESSEVALFKKIFNEENK